MYNPHQLPPRTDPSRESSPIIVVYNSSAANTTPLVIPPGPYSRPSYRPGLRIVRIQGGFFHTVSRVCLPSGKTRSPLCIYTCRRVSLPAHSRRPVAEMEEKCVHPSHPPASPPPGGPSLTRGEVPRDPSVPPLAGVITSTHA
jgi:hypothetical protein